MNNKMRIVYLRLKFIYMKKIIFLILLLVSFSQISNAQDEDKSNATTVTFDFSKSEDSTTTQSSFGTKTKALDVSKNATYYQKKIKQSKHKKLIGIILSSLGGAVLGATIGGYFAINNKNKSAGYSAFRDNDLLLQVGIPASAALIGTGIPIAIIGAKKEKKYKKKLSAL